MTDPRGASELREPFGRPGQPGGAPELRADRARVEQRAVRAPEPAVDSSERTVDPPEQTITTPEQTVDTRDDLFEREDVALVLVDQNPETLVDERRSEGHPEQFGHAGRPMRRNSPFYVGFFGALGVLLAYLLAQAVSAAQSVLVLIVVSMFLAIGLNPVVESLMRRGLKRGLAVGCVFLVTVLAFVGFGAAIVPPVAVESQQFVASAPASLERLRESETISSLNERYQVIERAQAYLSGGNLGQQAFGGLLGFGRAVLGTVFNALVVLILTLYFLASLPVMKRQIYHLVPLSRRERVSLLGDEILLRIGGYVSGAFTVGFISGVAAFLFLRLVGMPYPLALALLTGVMSLVPLVGATIALVIVATIGVFHSLPVGIACVVYYVLYQQVENYLIYPRVMSKAVDVPAALTIVAALVGGTLLGVVGALLAIPMAAAILLITREVLIPQMESS